MEVSRGFFLPGAEGLLSPLMPFFNDDSVTEILINKPGEVFVEREGKMQFYQMPALNEVHLRRLFTLIANENEQGLTRERPLLSGNLFDGSRVQLVIPPASAHYTLSIRRPSKYRRTLKDYRESGFYDKANAFDFSSSVDSFVSKEDQELMRLYERKAWADFMDLAILSRKNIVVSGETSSGKTTYLNACTSFIPHSERIITLEDTFEINIPHQNVVRLRTFKQNRGKESDISMQDLVQCSLRLRPDRIIMGEIRGEEVLDFISASSTGHEGTITTIHANNPRGVFLRMMQLYKLNNVPSMRDEDIWRELNEVVDIIIQVNVIENDRFATSFHYKPATKGSFF